MVILAPSLSIVSPPSCQKGSCHRAGPPEPLPHEVVVGAGDPLLPQLLDLVGRGHPDVRHGAGRRRGHHLLEAVAHDQVGLVLDPGVLLLELLDELRAHVLAEGEHGVRPVHDLAPHGLGIGLRRGSAGTSAPAGDAPGGAQGEQHRAGKQPAPGRGPRGGPRASGALLRSHLTPHSSSSCARHSTHRRPCSDRYSSVRPTIFSGSRA
jgi:hypothetical protein